MKLSELYNVTISRIFVVGDDGRVWEYLGDEAAGRFIVWDIAPMVYPMYGEVLEVMVAPEGAEGKAE